VKIISLQGSFYNWCFLFEILFFGGHQLQAPKLFATIDYEDIRMEFIEGLPSQISGVSVVAPRGYFGQVGGLSWKSPQK